MSTTPPLSHAPEPALLDRQLAMLDRLAEMGMSIAGAIEARVKATTVETPDAVLHHAALDFGRAARAVRLTLALQSKLVQDAAAQTDRKAAATQTAKGPDVLQVRWQDGLLDATRRRMQTQVRAAAEAEALGRDAIERLMIEVAERMEDDDIHTALMDRSFPEVVALICAELGLAAPVAGQQPRPQTPGQTGFGGPEPGPQPDPASPLAAHAAHAPSHGQPWPSWFDDRPS